MHYLIRQRAHLALFLLHVAKSFAVALTHQNILRLNPTLLYNISTNFVGNSSETFLQTTGLKDSTATMKPFVAYDEEFEHLLAEDATLELLYTNPDNKPVADEMGIWVWDHNQVWMSSSSVENISYTSILDLSDHSVKPLVISSNGIPILNPNGGGYFNGKVYIAGDGNATIPPAIYEINPVTRDARIVVDSYFGLRLNGPNDLTWGCRGNKSWLFFTDDPLGYYYNNGDYPTIPDATWRWDPEEETLLPVIDRTDILIPNGIRVNKDSTKLYVTDTPSTQVPGSGFVQTSPSAEQYYGSDTSAIYEFDLSPDGFPYNKRLFGITQRGISDGLHLDDDGRIWTAEADGIVVRSSSGKVLGMINALAIEGRKVADSNRRPLQNFALAGDRIIVLAYSQIYQVRLSRAIVESMT
ncbi:hypothetical protein HDV63DRAFT_391738 [Trichoderma sp. SZMC 28014]